MWCVTWYVKDYSNWRAAFHEGVQAVKFYGGAREGYRTMLDALCPADEAILQGTRAN